MNKLYRFFVLTSFVLVSMVLTAGMASADIFTFTATLSGANEVPPNASPALGIATLIVDQGEDLNIPLHVEFSGLTGTQTGAHIHLAPEGSNGGVVFPVPLGSPVDTTIFFDLPALLNLTGGLFYLNIHTEAYPGGEIRGQFLLSDTVDTEDTTWGGIKSLYR